MAAPPNYLFSIFAFVSFFLCLIKFPTQWHAWNVGIHLFQAWAGLLNLQLGINSIVWNNNTVNWAPVWCDITSRCLLAIYIALPAVTLCINRRLYLLTSTSVQSNKCREIMIDIAIGIGLPILTIILSFFTQTSRFLIVEDYGCAPAIFNSWVAIVILYAPPVALELISGVYGCLTIHAVYKRRSRRNELLSSNLNSTQYIRLMCFSICDLIVGIPYTAFCLQFDIKARSSFPGLSQEHQHFSRIIPLPAFVWRSNPIYRWKYEWDRWMLVGLAFAFFAIFGFTRESYDKYRAALQTVIRFFMMSTGNKSRLSSETEGIEFTATGKSDLSDTSLN